MDVGSTRLPVVEFVCRLALLLALPGSAHADSPDLWDLSIDELMQIEVHVAARAERSIADSPTAVNVYGRDEIRALGARYLHQLLPYVPGFQVSLDVVAPQQHTLSARGAIEFNSPGLLILRDGRRINDEFTRGAPLFSRWISLENVSRVEVLRGPGSVLYGSNAVVGVINLVTGTDASYALVEAGDPGMVRSALAIHETVGKYTIDVFGEALTDDGQTRAVFDRHNRATESADPRWFHDLGLTLRRGSTRLAIHQQRRRFDDFHGVGGNVGNGFTRDETRVLSVTLQHDWAARPNLDSVFSVDYRKADSMFLFLQAPDGTGPFVAGDFLLGGDLDHAIFSFSVENEARFGSRGTLIFGGEWIHGQTPRAQIVSTYDLADPSIAFGEPRTTDSRFAEDQDSRNLGAYVEHTWDATRQLRLRAGVRIDNDRFSDTSISPRLGLEIQPNPRHRISLVSGRAFRSPGPGELFQQNQPLFQGNPDLDATKLDTHEIGYRFQISHALVSASLFHNHTSDAIVNEQIASNPPLSQFRNSGKQTSVGVEFDAMVRLGDDTRLRVGGTHLFKNDTGVAGSASSPALESFFAATFGFATFQHRLGPADLSVGVQYKDAIDALPDQGPVVLVNLRSSFRISNTLQSWVRVGNALDHDYDTAASGAGLGIDGAGITRRDLPARGREWSMGLQKNF